MSLVWQNPAATIYPRELEKNFENLLAANRYIYESAVRYPEKFIPAGWTDPKALGYENAVKLAGVCVLEYMRAKSFAWNYDQQRKSPISSNN